MTYKEKLFFQKANHDRVAQLIKAGKNVDALRKISPSYFIINITWRCNSNCLGCIDEVALQRKMFETKSGLDMSWDICKDILDYAKENKVLGAIIQGGEPLLYPYIDKFLHSCVDSGLMLRLVTNGSMIDKHFDSIAEAFNAQRRSVFRVSINADGAHYAQYTRREGATFHQILKNIEELSKRNVKVCVSTVYFGRSSHTIGFRNFDQLWNIINAASKAGADMLLLLPGRAPGSRSSLPLNKSEIRFIQDIPDNVQGMRICKSDRPIIEEGSGPVLQNKDFCPCPTSLLRVVVDPDGTLYACTEHIGDKRAVLGKIDPPAVPFSAVWHSEERVKKHLKFDPRKFCGKITCDRYGTNSSVEAARAGYEKFKCPSIISHLLLESSSADSIFF